MSLPARAVSTTTGHPVLKLVLLTVASLPGYPAAADVAAAAELSPGMTGDALGDLCARRLLFEHRSPDRLPPTYALPDDGWGFTRADTEDNEVPAAAPIPDHITGCAVGGRVHA